MTRRNDGLTTGMTNAERLRTLRADAVANGMCLECRCRKPRDGIKTCDVCLERQDARKVGRRLRGLCACGRLPVRGLTECRRCKERKSARDTLKYAADISAGLCPRCRIASPEPNRVTCAKCLDAMAALTIAEYRANNPDARQHRCSVCQAFGHKASRHTRDQQPGARP